MSSPNAKKKKFQFDFTLKLRAKGISTEDLKDDLIGSGIDLIPHSRLPIQKVILQRWRGLRKDDLLNDSKTKSDAEIASEIANEVIAVWNSAHIPTIRDDKVKKKVVQLIEGFKCMKKNCKRYEVDKEPLLSYSISLHQLFDVSPENLQQQLAASHRSNSKWNDDWEFYVNQCKVPQQGSIEGCDLNHAATTKRRLDRERKEEKHRECEVKRKEQHNINHTNT